MEDLQSTDILSELSTRELKKLKTSIMILTFCNKHRIGKLGLMYMKIVIFNEKAKGALFRKKSAPNT